ncbi:phage recombination protein Bet [Altererythrobacter indicus]|uniref:Phage recombination protein Bet n=2 Tax=Altericroceibacterium indicum TaxID=374177 RepID=A0A845ACE3_9SPHN|nr:phage recombination protein Bet [Altericroceibacterium indicum]
MAYRLEISPTALKNTLANTVFAGCRSEEEFMALIVVANEYGLNPLLKEMYAFPGKGGGIVPMVSVDGWIRIMNSHPDFDGIEFDYHANDNGNIEAIEAIIYHKGRSHPIKVIEYLDECKRNTDPWKISPRRMLRHRALIQCARVAFGFSGIYADGDEGEVIDMTPQQAEPKSLPSHQSIAEQIDDEVPNFDKETGEIGGDQKPKRDAKTGMTEVDEETARRLDAEQTAEDIDGRTEDDDDAKEESPSDAKLRQIRESIDAAKNIKGLKAVDAEWVNARAAYDDDTAKKVDALIAIKRKELGE